MKQRLKNWLLKNFLGNVVVSDIIQYDEKNRLIKLGNEYLTAMELNSLNSEVKALEGMRLWQILNETIKQKAFERGWLNSTTLEHLNTAKTQYSTLELQQNIINLIKKYKK